MSGVDPTLLRRIMGTAAAVLVVAAGYLGLEARYSPVSGSYEVEAVLGRAGSGLKQGSDIKVRGVRVGEVAGLRFEEGVAIATLRFDPEPALPSPDQLELAVTAKTLLGEKQIEISFPDDAFGSEPALAGGDRLEANRQPTELGEVLDELAPFLDAIEDEELATIIEALAEQQGESEVVVENLELGRELARFGARTADDNLANLRRLTDVADSLTPVVDDMTRLNAALPEATRVLREEQERLTQSLDTLSSFSVGLAEFLESEEPTIDTLLRSGDVVGAMLERRQSDIGDLVFGLYSYLRNFPHGIALDDGTEAAGFRIFIDLSHGEGDLGGLDAIRDELDGASTAEEGSP